MLLATYGSWLTWQTLQSYCGPWGGHCDAYSLHKQWASSDDGGPWGGHFAAYGLHNQW